MVGEASLEVVPSGVGRNELADATSEIGTSLSVVLHLYAGIFFFFQAEDGIRDYKVTGVQTCALPILRKVPELAGEEAIAANPAWAEHHAAAGHIETARLEDLEWADALLFGTPTRFEIGRASCRERV